MTAVGVIARTLFSRFVHTGNAHAGPAEIYAPEQAKSEGFCAHLQRSPLTPVLTRVFRRMRSRPQQDFSMKANTSADDVEHVHVESRSGTGRRERLDDATLRHLAVAALPDEGVELPTQCLQGSDLAVHLLQVRARDHVHRLA